MSGITHLVNHIHLPRFVRTKQFFPHNELSQEQIAQILDAGFQMKGICEKIQPKMRICITCGSRGVSNSAFVIRYMVERLREMGAEPFLIPTMGSHGGATAEGQKVVLASLGITEESMGCPILSSMETVQISQAEDFEVCIDKNAYHADGIIVLNRVKAHTSFQGPYESGLMKMMTIGLGKQYGAHICHAKGDDFMSHRISLIGSEVIRHANVIMGVALLENAFDRTFDVVVLPAEDIPKEEPQLLTRAKAAMGRIMFDSCDVLITQQIGKNFSGSGADPNIVGRSANPKLKMGISAQRMGVLDISEESHGNATGMGRFDIAPQRFFKKLSFDNTYPNFITDYGPSAYKIPVIVDSDEEVMKTAVATCLQIDYQNPRIIIIKNSLEIESILISEALIPEAQKKDNLTIEGEPFFLEFDPQGNLLTQY